MPGQFQLAPEGVHLHVRRRQLAVVVEPYLAHGHHLGRVRQPFQRAQDAGVQVFGLVRVHADGGVDVGVGVRQVHRAPAALQVRADNHEGGDAGPAGTLQHPAAVGIERGILEMAVGVDQHPTARASLLPLRPGRGPAS